MRERGGVRGDVRRGRDNRVERANQEKERCKRGGEGREGEIRRGETCTDIEDLKELKGGYQGEARESIKSNQSDIKNTS